MAKKLDHREYQCELIKVVDGDTIDCYIDLGFNLKTKKRIRYMGIDTWESRTRDLEEKAKGLAAKDRNKHLLEQGVFKLKSFGTGKFGRVLGEIFVDPEVVGEHITECIGDAEHHIDIDENLIRPAEVDTLLADYSKAKKILKWEPKISFDELVIQPTDKPNRL